MVLPDDYYTTEISSSSSFGGLQIDVVYYPKEAFDEYGYVGYDGYFPFLIENFSPEGVDWSLSTYTDAEAEEFLAAAQALAPGSVVIVAPKHSLAPEVVQSVTITTPDSGCIYCFGDGNKLKYENLTMVSKGLVLLPAKA